LSQRPLRLATILAHPDDETFGIGGTLIKYTDAGVECHSLSLTQGEAGTNGDPADPIPRERLGAVRAEELAESGRRMGLASTTCFTYPDGGVAKAAAADVVRDIVRWLRTTRPDVVITWGPDGGNGHADHVATGELAIRAVELAGVARHEPELGEHVHVRRCYRMVTPADALDRVREQSPDLAAYMDTLEVKPHRWTREELGAVIDIRAVADRKWDAMQAHRSQQADLDVFAKLRDTVKFVSEQETYIRAFPMPGGPPLDTDLFAGVVAPRPRPPAGG
jgi:LmbE family N-acetylglucosaminyl deacetylase